MSRPSKLPRKLKKRLMGTRRRPRLRLALNFLNAEATRAAIREAAYWTWLKSLVDGLTPNAERQAQDWGYRP